MRGQEQRKKRKGAFSHAPPFVKEAFDRSLSSNHSPPDVYRTSGARSWGLIRRRQSAFNLVDGSVVPQHVDLNSNTCSVAPDFRTAYALLYPGAGGHTAIHWRQGAAPPREYGAHRLLVIKPLGGCLASRLRRNGGEKPSTQMITTTSKASRDGTQQRLGNVQPCKRIEILLRPPPKYERCHPFVRFKKYGFRIVVTQNAVR